MRFTPRDDLYTIQSGRHWLNKIAAANAIDLSDYLDSENLWDEPIESVAVSICEHAAELNGQEKNSTLIATVTPFEKAAIFRSAPGKMEDFIRETLLQKCAEKGPLPPPLEKKRKQPRTIEVKANVRFWEDATVDGLEDEDGLLIPFRNRDQWEPVIELDTGKIVDWPKGTIANIHYKVCDAGEYWIRDEFGNRAGKYNSYYVPPILSPQENGWGDYIILTVDENGIIEGWNPAQFNAEEWAQNEGR